MDSLLSFPVGLFHPLQHAGLSRRSPSGRRYIHNHALDLACGIARVWILRAMACLVHLPEPRFSGVIALQSRSLEVGGAILPQQS